MNETEIKKIIDALKEGKVYFKPLPYSSVTGGTWISYDKDQDIFKEVYINESIYDRGREEFHTNYTQEELIKMFENGKYTDRNYLFCEKSEEYSFLEEEKKE